MAHWKASVGLLGVEIQHLAATMLVPLVVAVAYGEEIWLFLLSMALVAATGFGVERVDPDPGLPDVYRSAGDRPRTPVSISAMDSR